jgi:ABC-type nitrate/sulfonate/bicarbonate transport system substrate-binding protein
MKLRNRNQILSIIIVFAFFLLAGRSSFSQPSPTSWQSLKLPNLTKLKVAFTVVAPNLQDMEMFLAKEKGIFNKYNLDVDVIFLNGDNLGLLALISGDADVSYNSVVLIAVAREKGGNVRSFLETTPAHDYMIIANKTIKNWSDLKGKTIGVSLIGSVAHLMPAAALEKNGVDVREVQFLSVGGSAGRAQALITKKVDAGMLHIIDGLKLTQKYDYLYMFSDLITELPDYAFVSYSTRAEDLKNPAKRDVLTAYTAGMIEGKRLMLSDKKATLDCYKKYYPNEDMDLVSKVYDILLPTLKPGLNGGLSAKRFNYTRDEMAKYKQLKGTVKFEDVYDTTLVDRALTALGKVAY